MHLACEYEFENLYLRDRVAIQDAQLQVAVTTIDQAMATIDLLKAVIASLRTPVRDLN